MEMIKIKTGEYYDRPEFYPYMPSVIFDALELAVLKGAVNGEEVLAKVIVTGKQIGRAHV